MPAAQLVSTCGNGGLCEGGEDSGGLFALAGGEGGLWRRGWVGSGEGRDCGAGGGCTCNTCQWSARSRPALTAAIWSSTPNHNLCLLLRLRRARPRPHGWSAGGGTGPAPASPGDAAAATSTAAAAAGGRRARGARAPAGRPPGLLPACGGCRHSGRGDESVIEGRDGAVRRRLGAGGGRLGEVQAGFRGPRWIGWAGPLLAPARCGPRGGERARGDKAARGDEADMPAPRSAAICLPSAIEKGCWVRSSKMVAGLFLARQHLAQGMCSETGHDPALLSTGGDMHWPISPARRRAGNHGEWF
jgi:hypothetical protein